MSSKKDRKRLRQERIKQLCPRAVWLHYKAEENGLYKEEMDKIYEAGGNMQMTLSEICALRRGVKLKWFGYAVARYNEWKYGSRKLLFIVRKGKVRARNINVIEDINN